MREMRMRKVGMRGIDWALSLLKKINEFLRLSCLLLKIQRRVKHAKVRPTNIAGFSNAVTLSVRSAFTTWRVITTSHVRHAVVSSPLVYHTCQRITSSLTTASIIRSPRRAS